jgi:hypothetical protein
MRKLLIIAAALAIGTTSACDRSDYGTRTGTDQRGAQTPPADVQTGRQGMPSQGGTQYGDAPVGGTPTAPSGGAAGGGTHP